MNKREYIKKKEKIKRGAKQKKAGENGRPTRRSTVFQIAYRFIFFAPSCLLTSLSSRSDTHPADHAAQKLLGTIYKDVENEASDTKGVHTKRMSLKKYFQSEEKKAGKRQQKGGKNEKEEQEVMEER